MKFFYVAPTLSERLEKPVSKERANTITSKKYTDEQYMQKICDRAKNSKLCNNRDLYNVLKAITKKYNVPIWIVLGIMSKESWFGTLRHSSNREDCKEQTNNRWWLKANHTESWVKRTTEVWPWCRLQKFDTIEEGFTSQVRTIGIWYKWCLNKKNPIVCISRKYVWSTTVSEPSRVNYVSDWY